jgi:1-acyl-sn-glycerol-3-phosphate acyltransferase
MTQDRDGTAPRPAPAPAPDPLHGGWFWHFCRMLARPIATFGFRLRVHGRHHVPLTGGVLLVSNHQSYLDPVMIAMMLYRPMCYLAKSELFGQSRYFAWLIRSLNAFPVKQGAGDVGAVKEMLKRLGEGWMLTMFPEGSRTEDGEIGPIEKGVALVLRRANVPCVPVVIEGSFDAWPKGRKIPHPHPIDVMFGPPLRLQGLKGEQITLLIDRTLRQMLQEVRRLRAQRKKERWQ